MLRVGLLFCGNRTRISGDAFVTSGGRWEEAIYIYAAILFTLANPTHETLCHAARWKIEGDKVLGTEKKEKKKPHEASGRQAPILSGLDNSSQWPFG